MIRVLLIHSGLIPHYRIPIYSYLSRNLRRFDFEMTVISDGIQTENSRAIGFAYQKMYLSAIRIARFVQSHRIEVIIDFMELKHRYLFPTYFLAKGTLRRKMIYWGQGRDLLDPEHRLKNLAYAVEQSMCSSIILYAEHLKKYVPRRFHSKVFVANNTLLLDYPGLPPGVGKEDILARYGIHTPKNIICIGRMQKRKRLDHLVEAFAEMHRQDIGLIFAGPDPDGVLDRIGGDHIFKLGPVYGDAKFDLLSSADVYCLPGAVGLSIVDAFHCGLPLVTEAGDESAEITYLKDGQNGFIVPRDDRQMLRERLICLLDDDQLRNRFSANAREEIRVNGSMEEFCSGFRRALFHAIGRSDQESQK
jgi:glycosyltransferase involved in cell wall biosynthesis